MSSSSAWPLLRLPGLRWLLAYRIGAMLSYQIVAVAVGWQLYQRTGDPLALGLVGLAEVLPYFCVAPFAGHLVDHLRRRRLGLFEHANGGTVFLDEVGDLPADAQTALLRVLQQGTLERIGSHTPVKVNVRVIAATHIDLESAVSAGRFRSDLYYRLNVLRLHLPPLAERGQDIMLLAEHALQDFRQRHRSRARGFSPECVAAMNHWPWPGNVRELINRIQRAAVICESEWIQPQEMELPAAGGATTANASTHAAGSILDDARRLAERQALLGCLQENDFNISATARSMGLSRVTIYRLCRRHAIQRQMP